MSTLRTVGILLAGVLAGAALLAAGGYWFGTTAQGQSLLRDFIVAQSEASQPQQPAQTPAGTAPAPAALGAPTSTVILVPKSYANEAYYVALNNVVADLSLINDVGVQLAPVLDGLNQKTLSCTFDGFYDLMGQARSLANRNAALAAQFSIHISDLAAANTQTKDAVTASQTLAVTAAGQSLGGALRTYAQTVQTLLLGGTPTSAQVAQLGAQVTAAQSASQSLADALKPLLEHIIAADQQLSGATSTAAH